MTFDIFVSDEMLKWVIKSLALHKVFILCYLMASGVAAQSVVDISKVALYQPVTQNIHLFTDKSGEMPVNEVIRQDFVPIATDQWFIPFSDIATWAKWEFENPTMQEIRYAILLNNQLLENTELYQLDSMGKEFVLTSSTNCLTSKLRDVPTTEPIHPFTIRANGITQIFVRVKTKRGVVLNASVFPISEVGSVYVDAQRLTSFLNGALIFRLFLVLVLGFFIIKAPAFRSYSLLILLKTLGFWGILNLLGPAFASEPLIAQKINYLAYTSSPYAILLVGYVLFPFTKRLKRTKGAFLLLVTLVFINHCLVLWRYEWYFLKAGIFLLMFISGMTLLLYAYGFIKKYKIQHYYAIPFLTGIGSYFLMNLQILMQVSIPLATTIAFLLFAAEILFFVFFLGKIFQDNESSKTAISIDLKTKELELSKLEELDELKNQFFTNISHELKTPLSLIASPLKELSKKYPKDKLVNLTLPNVKRLQDLIHQLLDIQKIEEGKQRLQFEMIDVAQYLRLHVLSFESMAVVNQVTLNLQQSHHTFEACVDMDKLNKIVDNLLSNAIKYSPAGGQVEVITVFGESPEHLQFTVKDQGEGIAPKDLPYIFDRFYRVESDTHQGSGVGLALVKELVNLWNGTIDVSSKLGRGTSFTVNLPVAAQDWQAYLISDTQKQSVFNLNEKPKPIADVTEQTGQGNEEKPLVLIVDDNEDMRTYLSLLLENEYEIITAFDGQEGVAKANQEVPDLIISDLMMPRMDGHEFSRRIKGQLSSSHVPVIMLTAKSSKESKMAGLKIGIDHYLHKPFDADELKQIVRNSLDNRTRVQNFFASSSSTSTNGTNQSFAAEHRFITQLNEVLETRYFESKLSVGDIVEKIYLSEKQFRRKLKAVADTTPVDYLRKFRLQKAAGLLKTTSLSVSEIAFNVGFENLSYFSKVFQQEYGKLPSEYAS